MAKPRFDSPSGNSALWQGLLFALLAGGCAVTPRHPVPKDLAASTCVPGHPDARVMVEYGDTNSLRALQTVLQGFDASGGKDHELNILALSGGGPNGAYGAGLLCGWSRAATRPEFDIVTVISTGSLIAPLAFLGEAFDPLIREGYTKIKPEQVFLKRGLFSVLKHQDALADSKPLQTLIAQTIGEPELTAIAREHRKGRRLLVMTANLDSQKAAVWNIGAIAASGRPDALELTRKVLLASSSIPVALPPVLFNVEAGGQRYDEMHVDGGVMAQVFGGALLLAGTSEGKSSVPATFYLIRNGRLNAEYAPTQQKLGAIAGRSIATLMKVEGNSDVLRAWMFTTTTHSNFRFVAIPDDLQIEQKQPFDPEYMKALFDAGFAQGRAGIPWQEHLAGFQEVKW